jgi:dihydrofolate reductase
MIRTTYYAATSIDGFIADDDGGVDWLSRVDVPGEDYGYKEFFGSVDGLLMGRATYDFAASFGSWPYGDVPCWVWTSRPMNAKTESIVATTESPSKIIEKAEALGMQHLWFVGGGALAAAFVAEGCITDYIISVVPVALGSGVPLVNGLWSPASLELKDVKAFGSGLVQLVYAVSPTRV